MNVPSEVLSSALLGGKRFCQSLLVEVKLMWQFIGRDYSSALLPALLFLVASWKSKQYYFGELLLSLVRGFLYFWLFALSFCIANQIVGIDEDRINKPERPLVTGSVSHYGAWVRWACSMTAFLLIGWQFGVLEWALLWQVCIILSNFGSWDKHWFSKNVIMGVGTFAQLAAAWQLVVPITSVAWRWIFMLAAVWLTISTVQDLRDIEGDRAIGRNTLPIAFGETASRAVLSLGFGLLPLVTHSVLMMPAGNSTNILLWDIGLAIVSLIISVRIIFYNSPQADHRTYMLFTYWFCLVSASAIAVL
jgi:4-hydroxybenzoate polyprenyltransferase